jgi:hypothetical protein
MSTRAPTTAVNMGQMGLASLARDWLYNDELARFANDRARRAVQTPAAGVAPHALVPEPVRRDLQMIVHSEDVEPADRGASYINPFRGRPGEYDPVAEVVLRRLAAHYEGDADRPHMARLQHHMVLQSVLRLVQSIRDAHLTPDRAHEGIALILACLWRLLLCTFDTDEAASALGEFWDILPPSYHPLLRQCQSVPDGAPFDSSALLNGLFPDYVRKDRKMHMLRLPLGLNIVRNALRRIRNETLDKSLYDQGISAPVFGLALRMRGRTDHSNAPEVGNLVHAFEEEIRSPLQRDNVFHALRNNPLAFNLEAERYFECGGRIGSPKFDEQNEYVLQALLPYLIRAFHGCAPLRADTRHRGLLLFRNELLLAVRRLFDTVLPPVALTVEAQWHDLCKHLTAEEPLPPDAAGHRTPEDWDIPTPEAKSTPSPPMLRWSDPTDSPAEPNMQPNPLLTHLLTRYVPSDLTSSDNVIQVKEALEKANLEYRNNIDLHPGYKWLTPIFSRRILLKEDTHQADAKRAYFQRPENYHLPFPNGIRHLSSRKLTDTEIVEALVPYVTTRAETEAKAHDEDAYRALLTHPQRARAIANLQESVLSEHMPKGGSGLRFDLQPTHAWHKADDLFDKWHHDRTSPLLMPTHANDQSTYRELLREPTL